jgi:hypothetical protein
MWDLFHENAERSGRRRRRERCVDASAADTSRQNLNLYHKYGVNLAEKTSQPKVNILCIKSKLKNLNLRAGFVKICKNLLTRKWLIAESTI